MVNEHLIKISEELDSHLGMNFVAEEFFDGINNSDYNKITIDFDNVKFVSRSFAQEYLFQKLKTDKEIVEVNVPEDAQKMFDVVSKDFE
ncbi:STAS-like domain-containing protein [uncultured Methanobrevibacter sp.]|uniref:STAS-like domain-containing protein n=1 Tax=uncultured Methanobrevibacter sp. TaxID=253161 RepID=UPI0025E4AD91|nr:DUF4325 domain-containing protein [uncultured Methanobrevibacter sp.]